jgi:hypothetical protein
MHSTPFLGQNELRSAEDTWAGEWVLDELSLPKEFPKTA